MMSQAGVQVASSRLPNLPPLDLLTGPRDNYLKFCLPLYQASIKCDWEAAKAILGKTPELVRYSITVNGETTLHVAASTKVPRKMGKVFVKNLVDLMGIEDLALENENFNTALYLAAATGNLETVQIMVEKNRDLVKIPGGGAERQMLPLYAAALFTNYNVVEYLFTMSNDLCDADGWNDTNRGWLLVKCVQNDMFDVALQIVKKYPELGRRGSVLGILAQKPYAFIDERKHKSIIHIVIDKMVLAFGGSKVVAREGTALQLLSFILEQDSKSAFTAAKDTHFSETLFAAVERGNTIFVVELIGRYPDIMWKVNDRNQTIFHIAVENRHADIYTMLYEIGYMKDSITSLEDENGNNMLHLVAKIAKKKKLEQVPGGVIFQMQRELSWFMEVKFMINPSCIEQKNNDGLTPHELFTEEHKDLLAQSVERVKGTVNQSVVAATIVATIAFAAAITVPGGYQQDNGIPVFYRYTFYTIFILADAISLLTSSFSILMFIVILTSRFAEYDFLESIPLTFSLFLSLLFVSIVTMIFSFCVSFFVIYHKEMQWIPIIICMITVFPVILYVKLQYALIVDMMQSIYGSRHLFKVKKHFLNYQNPVL